MEALITTMLQDNGRDPERAGNMLDSFMAMLSGIPNAELPLAFVETRKAYPEFIPSPEKILAHFKYLKLQEVEKKRRNSLQLPPQQLLKKGEFREMLREKSKTNPFIKKILKEMES